MRGLLGDVFSPNAYYFPLRAERPEGEARSHPKRVFNFTTDDRITIYYSEGAIMGHLRNHMIEEMKLRCYSDTTITMYTKCMYKLAYFYMKSPLVISQSEIRDFFLYLIDNRASQTTLHIFYCAIKVFYKIHGQPHYLDFMPHPKRSFKIPDVLDQSEIELILSLCRTLRYKTIFALIYSSGLRISEAINLKVSDLDMKRKTIHIRSSKNGKDRFTILGEKASILLSRYFNRYKPNTYLFFSIRDNLRKISKRHLQHIFHTLVEEASITKNAHVHTLRHSFATHLLENNTNLFYIMKLLGHSSVKSTIIYLHMQRLDKMNIVSPLDSSNISIDSFPNMSLQPLLNIA
jgi:integrase/recombinase XerD